MSSSASFLTLLILFILQSEYADYTTKRVLEYDREKAIERLVRYNPNIKLIIVLRNPITRAYSHWNMMRNRNKENLSFVDAIAAEPERLKKSPHNQDRKFSYIDRGYYSSQIKKVKELVPEENLLIIKHDDLLTKPEKVLSLIYNFLGIKADKPVINRRVHENKYEIQSLYC